MWNKNNKNWWYRKFNLSSESCWAVVRPATNKYELWKGEECLESGTSSNAEDAIEKVESIAKDYGFLK